MTLTTQNKVWRVPLLAQELIDCWFDPERDDNWERVLKPMLMAKGLPEGYLLERTPFKWSEGADGEIILEFDR